MYARIKKLGLIQFETSPANTCYSSVDFDDSSVDFNDSSGAKVSAGTAKTQIQYLSALNLLWYFDILLCKK